MGNREFDAFARRLAPGHSRRAVFRGFFGGVLLTVMRAGTSQAGPAGKVTICHKPGTPAEATLTVAASAVKAHLGHGDRLGACNTCSVKGAIECDGTGFRTCSGGTWVYRDCAPDTVCRPADNGIVCEWA